MDRDFLRFLWSDNVFNNVIVRNRFARVIFAVTSSPHMLNEIIHKHANEYDSDIDFVTTLFNSLYVDDSVVGENSLEGAFLLFKKLKLRFLKGLFHLKQRKTNDPKLREFTRDSNSNREYCGIYEMNIIRTHLFIILKKFEN